MTSLSENIDADSRAITYITMIESLLQEDLTQEDFQRAQKAIFLWYTKNTNEISNEELRSRFVEAYEKLERYGKDKGLDQ